MRTRLLTLLLASVALVAMVATSAPALTAGLSSDVSGAEQVTLREDGDWTEHYFPAGDGVTMLHADVIRPKGYDLTDAQPTPVILTVSPYTNHNGSTTDLDLNGVGPNPRFFDFLDRSQALDPDRDGGAYTYVAVDLPGDGGSGGCNDWGGLREQDAVRAAVEWAASQDWSTGKVGMLGKSYDGWTGLMGIAQQPRGLAAVASLEPVYSGYRYIYNNSIHRSSTVATIGLFQVIDAKPGRPGDEPQYLVNSAPQAWCYGVNLAGSNADLHENGPYWEERNLLLTTIGRTTPLFLTQGFLETNTLSDAAFQYYNGLAGSQNRAWYGQFDHVRGWEQQNEAAQEGDYLTGRDTFMDELMRFFDLHLKDITPDVDDAPIVVQDIRGRYRDEAQWPPADMRSYTTSLNAGSYTDNGSGNLLTAPADGIWTVSEPLAHDVWFAGEPSVTVRVDGDTLPTANLAVGVYEITSDNQAYMISRGVTLLHGTGARNVSLQMMGQDWPIPAGSRIGVVVTDADTSQFTHVASRTTVDVLSADIRLPFLTEDRTEFGPGDSTARLEQYMGQTGRPLAVQPGMVTDFTLPGPLQ